MQLQGLDFIREIAQNEHFSAKMVFNARGAIFFPVSSEHRDMKSDGISYEDNYRGNALAAMVSAKGIEVRFHQAFSADRVQGIISELLARAEMQFASTWQAIYQGRVLNVSPSAKRDPSELEE